MNQAEPKIERDAASTALDGSRANPMQEVLPLSLIGRWVAWSADGMRIVASALTSDEAVELANQAGEPEPILQRHTGRHQP